MAKILVEQLHWKKILTMAILWEACSTKGKRVAWIFEIFLKNQSSPSWQTKMAPLTTRKKPISSAGFWPISSAGKHATDTVLQLNLAVVPTGTRYYYIYLVVALFRTTATARLIPSSVWKVIARSILACPCNLSWGIGRKLQPLGETSLIMTAVMAVVTSR